MSRRKEHMYIQFALSHISYETVLHLNILFNFYYIFLSECLCVCVHVGAYVPRGMGVVRGELAGVSSLFYYTDPRNQTQTVRLATFSHWAIRPGLWHSSNPCIYFTGLHSISADGCYKHPSEVLLYTVCSCIQRRVLRFFFPWHSLHQPSKKKIELCWEFLTSVLYEVLWETQWWRSQATLLKGTHRFSFLVSFTFVLSLYAHMPPSLSGLHHLYLKSHYVTSLPSGSRGSWQASGAQGCPSRFSFICALNK